MKYLLNIAVLLSLTASFSMADEYDIWESESEYIFSKCMSQLVDFPGYKIVPPQRERDEEEEGDEDEDVMSIDEQFALEGIEGSIDFNVKSRSIAKNVHIAEDMGAIYRKAIECPDEFPGPFLGPGIAYIFWNKTQNKYYYCFIEWEEQIIKWNGGKETWNTRMFPGALDFLDLIPRIYIAPLAPIGSKAFLKEDISVIIDGSAIPSYINKTARKPVAKQNESKPTDT